MIRSSTTVLVAVLCVTASIAFAQRKGTPPPALEDTANGTVRLPKPPLFFREEWNGKTAKRGCSNFHDALCEPALTQEYNSDPKLELTVYGGGKQRMEHGEVRGAVLVSPGGSSLFTGVTEQPWAVALRHKDNYVDLNGLGKIRWSLRSSGLHVVHPIIKLADGTWLLNDHAGGGNQFESQTSEFNFSEGRWILLDIDRVVTLGPHDYSQPYNAAKSKKLETEFYLHGIWLDRSQIDLSKVDAVGFADLMPGSGHGYGGFISMGTIEVYGTPVPR
jgi:hypothetical protein